MTLPRCRRSHNAGEPCATLRGFGAGDYQTPDGRWFVRKAQVEDSTGRVLSSVRAWDIARADPDGWTYVHRVVRLSEARRWIAQQGIEGESVPLGGGSLDSCPRAACEKARGGK